MSYTNSPLVDYVRISPNRNIGRKHEIDTVTIHCVVGQCSVETLGNVFAPSSRQASCQYGIGYDGRIGMYCEEKDRSWCTSSSANDNRAITIEVASDTYAPYAVTSAAYESLLDLLVDICKRNPKIGKLKWVPDKSLIGQTNKQNMTVHRWFDYKSCPGDYLYNRHAEIAAEVNGRLGSKEEIKSEVVNAAATLSAGDHVTIKAGAKYSNGKSIPTWVIQKEWIVENVKNNRAIINKSVDGKNAIMSAVDPTYLVIVKDVKDTTAEAPKEEPKPATPSATVNAGDVVKIKAGAKYYDGKDIPDWVEAKQWVVLSAKGDRIVIGKSADGKNSINSPINSKWLTLVEENGFKQYGVKVEIPNLRIRKGPGTNYGNHSTYCGVGVYTIVDEKAGTGSTKGWGLLKAYEKGRDGWISLDFAKRF